MKILTKNPLRVILISCLLMPCFFATNVSAQFYYNDIVSEQQSKLAYNALVSNSITNVSAKCFDENDEPESDFIFLRKVFNKGERIETTTHLPHGDTSYTVSVYSAGFILQSTDSSGSIITKTNYTYSNGMLSTLSIFTDDNVMDVQSNEQHVWFYANNKPSLMLRIKDNNDTTSISFLYDDAGNVAEEIWKKKGRTIEHYFYYYDGNNQLTDIVRYNQKAGQMLPDFLLDYTTFGAVASLTQVPAGSSDYTTWKYIYDERNLKQSDMLFDKEKEQIGRIAYSYN